MVRSRAYALFIVVFLAVVPAARQAAATLGGGVDSVESDRKGLAAVRSAAVDHSGYTIHEIRSDATTVREYLSPAGVVFGLAWSGLAHPDLSLLLGSYAKEYRGAMQQASPERGRRSLRLKTERIVVEKWGHMRDLRGRAYVPALLPAGVNADEIK
jgi:uncharacterized protein DUF2844